MNRFRKRKKRRRRKIIVILIVAALLAAFLVPYCLEPGIPVLMYHCIAGEPRTGDENLYCRPAQLEEQFDYLKQNGYTTLFAEEYEKAYGAHKPVILTFDDGYEDCYTELYPLLKKYDFKATIFMVGDYIDKDGYLSSEQIREMAKSGYVSVQSHTAHHVDLASMSGDELDGEFRESCANLAKATGKNVTAISYPGGYFNDEVLRQTKRYFTYGYAIDTNKYSKSNHYEISRGGVFRNTTLEAYKRAIETYSQSRIVRDWLKIYYKIFD